MYVYFLWHRMYRMKWKVMKMNKSILQSTCPIVHLLLPGVWKHWTNYITFWLIFTTLVLFPIYILYTVQCKITGHSLDLSDNVLYDWLFPHTDCIYFGHCLLSLPQTWLLFRHGVLLLPTCLPDSKVAKRFVGLNQTSTIPLELGQKKWPHCMLAPATPTISGFKGLRRVGGVTETTICVGGEGPAPLRTPITGNTSLSLKFSRTRYLGQRAAENQQPFKPFSWTSAWH